MIDKAMKLDTLYQMFKYLVFGGLAAVVDFSLLVVLVEVVGMWYWYSAAISFTVGGFVNYFLNKRFTFNNKSKKYALQVPVFFIVAFSGLILNQIIIYVLVEYISITYVITKIISLGIVFFWSFTLHKTLTYRIK